MDLNKFLPIMSCNIKEHFNFVRLKLIEVINLLCFMDISQVTHFILILYYTRDLKNILRLENQKI